jgi:hypothetical protein
MKLVDEWRSAWRWLTVQLGAVVAVAPEIYEQVKAMGDFVSVSTFHHIMAVMGILVILNTVKKKKAA